MVSHSKSKNKELFSLCRSLKYTQRIIFSDEPFVVSDFVDMPQLVSNKPYGLWYSFGPAWIDFLSNGYQFPKRPIWCQKHLFSITHVYKLHLRRKYIYKIANRSDLDRFAKKYGYRGKINWGRVKKRWGGVEIRWQGEDAEKAYEWYDGWDVSSGCIWDRRAINRVKLLQAWKAHWASSSDTVSF